MADGMKQNEVDAANAAPKVRGRPFQRGRSGNPAGRRKGHRHAVTVIAEQLLAGEAEALVRKAIEMALNGDGPALRVCLDRIVPPRKDGPVSIELPPILSASDAVAASAAVLAAVAAGEITPDEAARVMGLLTAHRTIVETADLEDRIAKLEQRK